MNEETPVLKMAAEENRRVLKARALALAEEPPGGTGEPEWQVVEFQLAQERYGIELAWVREVHPIKELTPVPCTPAFVLGIINVRGKILTVIDIKEFFGMPRIGISDLNKVIIVHAGEMELGILADQIIGVRGVARAELQPSLPTLTGVREEYLKGVTGDRLVLLDIEKLLLNPRIIVNEQVIG